MRRGLINSTHIQAFNYFWEWVSIGGVRDFRYMIYPPNRGPVRVSRFFTYCVETTPAGTADLILEKYDGSNYTTIATLDIADMTSGDTRDAEFSDSHIIQDESLVIRVLVPGPGLGDFYDHNIFVELDHVTL